MENDDYDYFTMSVKESMSLIFWTALISVSAVGLLLLVALQCSESEQKGTTMTTVWKAEVTQDMINHLSEEQRRELMRELSKAVDAIGSEYEVGREFHHE